MSSSTQVQLFSLNLSIIHIPDQKYHYFLSPILKLVLGTWKSDVAQFLKQHKRRRKHTAHRPESEASEASSIVSDNLFDCGDSNSDSEDEISSGAPGSGLGPEFGTSEPGNEDSTAAMAASFYSTSSTTTNSAANGLAASVGDLSLEDSPADTLARELAALLKQEDKFVHLSINPLECCIILPTVLVDFLFGACLETLGPLTGAQVLPKQYLTFQVHCDGFDEGQRVLELTAPLANEGIPLYFITTYFSDYVLVPSEFQDQVVRTLDMSGFQFSDLSNSYVSIGKQSGGDVRENSFTSHSTASARSVSYSPTLEAQTFDLFSSLGVHPHVALGTKLVLTATRGSSGSGFGGDGQPDATVATQITTILLRGPRYFSVTTANDVETSLLLESRSAKQFPSNLLIGSLSDYVIPILFDLQALPLDSAGIVAGVASRLLRISAKSSGDLAAKSSYGSNFSQLNAGININYLSTAKAGVVMVAHEDVDVALRALKELERESEPPELPEECI